MFSYEQKGAKGLGGLHDTFRIVGKKRNVNDTSLENTQKTVPDIPKELTPNMRGRKRKSPGTKPLKTSKKRKTGLVAKGSSKRTKQRRKKSMTKKKDRF